MVYIVFTFNELIVFDEKLCNHSCTIYETNEGLFSKYSESTRERVDH